METEVTLDKRNRLERLSYPLALLVVLLTFCAPNALAQDPTKETGDSTGEAQKRSEETDFENGIGISACSNGAYRYFVAEVISVIGGDQVVVAIRDHAEDDEFAPQVTVQLVGMEFPRQSELLEEAREQLSARLLGKTVWVSYKLEKLNSHDRVVGKITTDETSEVDGSSRTDVALQQIKSGFARYKDFGEYSQGSCDMNSYLKAEAEAKKAQLGIWKITP